MHELLRVVVLNHLLNLRDGGSLRAYAIALGATAEFAPLEKLTTSQSKDMNDAICVYLCNAHTAIDDAETIPKYDGWLPDGNHVAVVLRSIALNAAAIRKINPVITQELAVTVMSFSSAFKAMRSAEEAGIEAPTAKRATPQLRLTIASDAASKLPLLPLPPATKSQPALPTPPADKQVPAKPQSALPTPPADKQSPSPTPPPVAKPVSPPARELFFSEPLNLADNVILYQTDERTTIRGAMISDCYMLGGGVLLPWRGVTARLDGNIEGKLVPVAGLAQIPPDITGCFFMVLVTKVFMCNGVVTIKEPTATYVRVRIGK